MSSDLDGAQVLVTGGSGFIGRTVVRTLVAAGARVRVADLEPFPGPLPDPAAVEVAVGDLADAHFRDAVVTPDLDGVVHLAASRHAVVASLRDPVGVFATNTVITGEVLDAARRRGVERFVMTSSNAAVGDVGDAVIREDVPLRPLSPYGASKAAAEMVLSGYAGGYGMTTCALRLTNVYGPGMERKDSFVPRLMRAALAGSTVTVHGDGSQRRDLVHVEDVARGLLAAWRTRHTGPLVIGAGRSVSVLEIIDAARQASGQPIPVEHGPARPEEMPAVVVDIGRARSLGYEPAFDLADGMPTVWADFAARAAAEAAEAAGVPAPSGAR